VGSPSLRHTDFSAGVQTEHASLLRSRTFLLGELLQVAVLGLISNRLEQTAAPCWSCYDPLPLRLMAAPTGGYLRRRTLVTLGGALLGPELLPPAPSSAPLRVLCFRQHGGTLRTLEHARRRSLARRSRPRPFPSLTYGVSPFCTAESCGWATIGGGRIVGAIFSGGNRARWRVWIGFGAVTDQQSPPVACRAQASLCLQVGDNAEKGFTAAMRFRADGATEMFRGVQRSINDS